MKARESEISWDLAGTHGLARLCRLGDLERGVGTAWSGQMMVGWLLEACILATSKVISGWILTCDSAHSW